MTTNPDSTTSAPGRPITLTPVPPGVWLIVGGSVVAALGPLFGFLIGSMLGSATESADLSPIYLCLFAGIALGGLGIAAVLLGVRQVIRGRRGEPVG